MDLPFLERQVVEKRAERDEQQRRDLAFAQQMIKDSNLAVVLEAREKEVPSLIYNLSGQGSDKPVATIM